MLKRIHAFFSEEVATKMKQEHIECEHDDFAGKIDRTKFGDRNYRVSVFKKDYFERCEYVIGNRCLMSGRKLIRSGDYFYYPQFNATRYYDENNHEMIIDWNNDWKSPVNLGTHIAVQNPNSWSAKRSPISPEKLLVMREVYYPKDALLLKSILQCFEREVFGDKQKLSRWDFYLKWKGSIKDEAVLKYLDEHTDYTEYV
ncbi:MAG: hypothetical protein ACI9TY_001665 [Alphaproteobacteria bacterium]